MTSQGMLLRNMALVGQTPGGQMPAQNKPVFEQGVRLLFERWTALMLGVMNEWGGSSSRDKAEELLQDTIHWFYGNKNHEMLDLEALLDEALQVEFHIQAEDDSPYQVWGRWFVRCTAGRSLGCLRHAVGCCASSDTWKAQ